MKKAKLELQAGFRHSNRNENTFNIKVEDDISGTVIVEFALTPEDFMQFLGLNVCVLVEGEITENFDRVGKKREHKSVRVPYGGSAAEEKVLAEEIRDQFLKDGWETASITRHNYGLSVDAQKWVEVSE